jgi:carnitine-CoA ligase
MPVATEAGRGAAVSDHSDANFRIVVPNELQRRAELHPDRPFLAWQGGSYKSYAQLHDQVRRLAGGLQACGVERGDTVAIMLPNGLELVTAWFASNFLGAVEVPINLHDRGIFLAHVLSDSAARLLIIDQSILAEFEAIRDQAPLISTVIVVGGAAASHLGDITVLGYEEVATGWSPTDLVRLDHRDLMAVLYTSGTSGPAKGVMMSYAHACVSIWPYIEAVELTESDVSFICLPLFHSNAQVMQLLSTLLLGARASIWPGFNVSLWMDQIRSVGATVTNTLGVMCQSLFQQPPDDRDRDNPLRVVQTIPAPASVVRDFEDRFAVRCVDGYGLTDAAILSFRRAGEPLAPGSSGRPLETFDLVVADPETDEPVPTGTIGEILVRPRIPFGFMSGYWRNPEATLQAWRNLWFHTGDAGYLDPAGLLYFHDRLKDVIRVRGENVSSSMIEAAVRAHPAVAECAAVAVPGATGDDDIKVCVVLTAGWSVAPEELIAYCTPQMPYFAIPTYIEFHSTLPKTATDKIRKVLLRGKTPGVQTWNRRAARDARRSANTVDDM